MTDKRVCLVLTLGASMSLLACGDSGADAGRIGRRPAPQTEEQELRTTQPLMEGWRFVLDNDMSDEEALDANAADWAPVTLPHTWNAEDAASLQAEDFERGIGWYRLEFPTPTDGERHWLEFGAASIVADVWLNGEKLGQHRGGFTQFRFDVTDALAESGTNVLLVKADNNTGNSPDDPTAIDPLGGDFNESGGLYRHVSLISTPAAAHIALGDLGGPGVYAATTALEGTNATIDVRTKLQSAAGEEGDYTVRVSLRNAGGEVAATAEERVSIAAGDQAEVTQQLNVPDAHVWQGVVDPYLYQLVAELLDAAGTPIDRVIQRFGIRQIRFDPNQGVLLNGEHVRLNGGAIHQDFLGKAWATTSEDWDLTFSIIRELGANFVRLGHYTFPKYANDKADELGLITWAEKPSGLRTVMESCSTDDPDEAYLENARQQLSEHIRQLYNHPSIAVWSIGNETEAGQIFCSEVHDNVTAYLRMLNDLAKEEDPTRQTANAEFTYGNDLGENAFTTAGITDVLGTNRYYAWYSLEFEEYSPRLDALHEEFPEQSIGISEYGAGAALTHHTDNVLGGPPEVRSAPEGEIAFQPEEYQAHVHAQNYRVISSKPYLWGSTIWNLFDFGSAHRNEGDVVGVNTKGLVTFDRQTRKDAFYFYKANWATEPVTWIVGKRYTDRAYSTYDVRVFSNADSVELRVNDTSVATLPAAQCDLRECVFEDVTLQPGVNRITAVGNHAGTEVTDEVEWTWNRPDVNIAAGRLATGWESSTGTRWGSDHYFSGGTGEFYEGSVAHPLENPDDASGGVPDDIANTPDPMLYKYLRTGDFSYEIPLADGTYEVTLGFMEPDTSMSRGERVFGVTADGAALLQDYDVYEEAGGHRTVTTETFTVQVSGGRLVLDFTPTRGEAIVSTIKIQPAGGAAP